jgi:hypothetical protein
MINECGAAGGMRTVEFARKGKVIDSQVSNTENPNKELQNCARITRKGVFHNVK